MTTDAVKQPSSDSGPLLEVKQLTKHFPVTSGLLSRVTGQVRAVEAVSFELQPGETLGLVGESGCGKTTLGRSILRLIEPTSGTIRFDGQDVTQMDSEAMRAQRRDMQIIFQDPFSSLNPRMRVLDIVGEALAVHGIAQGAEMERRVAELLQKVGVPTSWVNRYPHEFSGGQRQRIGVARAIALSPKLIVCDEAVSALDVSIQAQVVNLLIELRQEMNLAYLFIAHDLSVVRHISHRIAVMYLGQIVELCESQELFDSPLHPYTQALLSAIPVADPRKRQPRVELHGDVPTPINPPTGCRFHTRCPAAFDRCSQQEPPLVRLRRDGDAPPHEVKCFHVTDSLEAAGLEPSGLSDTPLAAQTFEELTSNIRRRTDAAVASNRSAEAKLGAATAGTSPAAEADARSSASVAAIDAVDASNNIASNRINRGTASSAADEVRPPHPVWGLIALIAGIALLASPAAGLGAGLVLLAFWLLRGHFAPGGQRALALGLVLLSFGLYRAGAHQQATQAAHNQFEQLNQAIAEYQANTGVAPRSLSDLGFRVYPIFQTGKIVDPWGGAWRYRPPTAEGDPYELTSFGRDQVRHTRDDVTTLKSSNHVDQSAKQTPEN